MGNHWAGIVYCKKEQAALDVGSSNFDEYKSTFDTSAFKCSRSTGLEYVYQYSCLGTKF